jgi:hypothetical protein
MPGMPKEEIAINARMYFNIFIRALVALLYLKIVLPRRTLEL